jgi:primosomal protein N'
MSWTVSETVPQTDTVEVVLQALTQAVEAHGDHGAEALGGQSGEGWRQRYAEHIARTLADGGYTIIRTAS